jgi:hypothetical protein
VASVRCKMEEARSLGAITEQGKAQSDVKDRPRLDTAVQALLNSMGVANRCVYSNTVWRALPCGTGNKGSALSSKA